MKINYKPHEQRKILDLSFYCVLDNIDQGENMLEAEKYMRFERNKYLSKIGGLEQWTELRDRNLK